jgi:hypothetical protein
MVTRGLAREPIPTLEDHSLPKVAPFTPKPWPTGTGSDNYGALHVAAGYCALNRVPDFFPGIWQHGCVPPWQQLRPEVVIYDAPSTTRCWVARADEEEYLRRNAYRKARAIGLPIVYTEQSNARRVPGSLLVMPNHAIPLDKRGRDSQEYVDSIVRIAPRFEKVAACVSAGCIANGLWAPLFTAAGIPVIHGASVSDANSLDRMRALFETFEFMTTPLYGSHVAYSLYLGGKVSLWGNAAEPLTKEWLLRDSIWAKYPETTEQYCSAETAGKQEELLGRFRVQPWEGVEDRELGAWMVGEKNRLSPDEMKKAFRWGRRGRVLRAATETVRGSIAWRAARKGRQTLRSWRKG